MKVMINNINFYFNNNTFIVNGEKKNNGDFSDLTIPTIINYSDNHPLVADLEKRLLNSEQERRDLLDQLKSEKTANEESDSNI